MSDKPAHPAEDVARCGAPLVTRVVVHTDFGDYYECRACDDGWDFVGEPPFHCLHCGARIDGPDHYYGDTCLGGHGELADIERAEEEAAHIDGEVER